MEDGKAQGERKMEKIMAELDPPAAVDPIRGQASRSIREFPDGSKLVDLNLETKNLVVLEADGAKRSVPVSFEGSPIYVAVLCAGPDGKIYGSTAHPSRLFVYDPALDELIFYPSVKIAFKSLRVHGKHVFGGHYSDGVFWLLDTSAPITASPKASVTGRTITAATAPAGAADNPANLGAFSPVVNMPRNAFAHPDGKHIMISGQPGYGFMGGGLIIYNLETRQITKLVHTDLLPDYSTMGIAAMPDGNLLCGTSPRGGHGTAAPHTQAALYILDWRDKKVVWNSGPLEQAFSIQSMLAGPDNLYYCVDGDGSLLVFKVEGRALPGSAEQPDPGRRYDVKMKMVHKDSLEKYGAHTDNQAFVPGPDGKLYLALKKGLVRITPGSFKVEELAVPEGGIEAGLGIVGGRVYFASRGCLRSIALPEATGASKDSGIANHGAPLRTAENRGMTVAVDGKGNRVVLAWIAAGGTDNMLAIDVATGAGLKIPVKPYAGDNAFAVWHSTRGFWYSHYGSHFYEFDPKTLSFTFGERTASRCAMSMHEDRNGVIWASLFPGAGLVSFDPKTRKLVDHGAMNTEVWGQYPSFMALDDAGWVYVGIGNTLGQVVGYNPATGERRAYVPQKSRQQGVGRPLAATDGRVYATAPGWGGYEMYAGEATPIEALAQRRLAELSGDYEPGKGDYFIPARVFRNWEPGDAENSAIGEVKDGSVKDRSCAVWAPGKVPAEASRWLWKKDLDDSFELLLRARGGPCAGDLAVAFNGRELFNAPTPFKHEEASSLRWPVPHGALKEQENLLTISFKPDDKAAPEKQDAGGVTRMSVFYAVFKRSARK